MNAQPVLMTVTQKQSVAILMVRSLAIVTKDTQGMEKIAPVCFQFLYKVYTFSFKSLHPTTHHFFLFAMRCLNGRVKLHQQTIRLSTYPICECISCCAHILLPSINHGIFSDVDECQDGTHNCDSNALCSNSVGSFTCACFQGYSGNGIVCSGK